MSTKWAFAYAFVLLTMLLVAYFVAFSLHVSQQVQTALLGGLLALIPTLGAAIVKVLQNSPAGDVPIRKSLNGGVTEHLAENPQQVPQSIKHAVIAAEERKYDAEIGKKVTEAPVDNDQ